MNFASTYGNRRVFLTGHTGFKGSWLSEWLLKLGAELTGFSLDIPTQPSIFEELGLADRMGDGRGDVRDLHAVQMAIESARPSIIFHLAAQPIVRASYDDPIGTFATNIMGTANVLEAARRVPGVEAVVVVTTDKVYENLGQGTAFREGDSLGGHDPYSASKAGAEIVFSSYARSFFSQGGLKIASARAGNVIGGGDWAADRLIPDCVRSWTRNRPVLVRNPQSVRPWQHVLEPLSGYLLLGQRLLEKPAGVKGEAFNFGPAPELTRTTLELVQELEKNWQGASHQLAGEAAGDGKKEAAFLSLNVEKAGRELGWVPLLNFAQTVGWTARWYKAAADARQDLLQITQEQIETFEQLKA
jgi:CDP-glucose 4,6-dehydratase